MTDAVRKPLAVVADDDRDVRELVVHLLESDGWEAVPVCDGEETLEVLRRRSADLLVLDLMMPRVGGVSVLQDLRRQGAGHGPPVLVLSARCSDADIVACLDMGATDYVTKPFRLAELRSRARKLIGRG